MKLAAPGVPCAGRSGTRRTRSLLDPIRLTMRSLGPESADGTSVTWPPSIDASAPSSVLQTRAMRS
jgi:hypothetical protein